jgi:hypothetical protein
MYCNGPPNERISKSPITANKTPDLTISRHTLSAVAALCFMRYWEIIADNLSKADWSWGCISAIDSNGRPIWIADAHRDNGKRLVVRADEKLTAFLELERITPR